MRHPAAVLIALMVVIIAARRRRWSSSPAAPTTAPATSPSRRRRPRHGQVSLCSSCAHDYNPDAISGPKTQHPGQVGLAIDNDRNTAWTTQTYYYGLQSKPGVGLYVDAIPGVAARSMVIDTTTPGYAVQIFARRTNPNPDVFDTGPAGWTQVGGALTVARDAEPQARSPAACATATTWSGSPASGAHTQAAINEVALYY